MRNSETKRRAAAIANHEAARIIQADPGQYGGLMQEWARRILEPAPVGSFPTRAAQLDGANIHDQRRAIA